MNKLQDLLIKTIKIIFIKIKNFISYIIIKLKSIEFINKLFNKISNLLHDSHMVVKVIAAVLVMIFLITHLLSYLFNNKLNGHHNFVVSVATVKQQNVAINIDAPGKVHSLTEIAIKPQIEGTLLHAFFKEGDIVEKDQLLFEIEPDKLISAYNQAQANVNKARANLDNSELQLNKYKQLYKENFFSHKDYEQIVANVAINKATLDASAALLDFAKIQLDYTKIYAPIAGVTGEILIDPGNIVRPLPGMTLVNIKQTDPVHVTFTVPEKYLPKILVNLDSLEKMPVSLSGFSNQGKLVFVDNTVDNLNGTITLKAEFHNCELSLWPGQFVNVILTIESLANTLVVPNRAVQVGQQGTYVYVAEKIKKSPKNKIAKAKKNLVKIGPIVDNNQTVILEGLQPGQIVITEGHTHLHNNSIVELYEYH